MTLQLNITAMGCLLSIERICRHLLWLAELQNSWEFCSDVRSIQGMGCLCIPNCVCHFELAKLNWRVLGEVCSKMGQFPDLPWIDSTLGKGKSREVYSPLWGMRYRLLNWKIPHEKDKIVSRKRGQRFSCDPCGGYDLMHQHLFALLWG